MKKKLFSMSEEDDVSESTPFNNVVSSSSTLNFSNDSLSSDTKSPHNYLKFPASDDNFLFVNSKSHIGNSSRLPRQVSENDLRSTLRRNRSNRSIYNPSRKYTDRTPLTCNLSAEQKDLLITQASICIDDALDGRQLYHNIDPFALKYLYSLYYNKHKMWFITFITHVYMLVSFLEKPRHFDMPDWIPLSLEFFCLMIIAGNMILKYFLNRKIGFVTKWNLLLTATIVVSFIDLIVLSQIPVLNIRVRRYLRALFCIGHHSQHKQMIKNIGKTLPNLIPVFFLLVTVLVVYSYLGMTLFQGTYEGHKFFPNFGVSLHSLIILLTTANHPDVMIPIYNENRAYLIFFASFLLIGFYFLLNIFTAVTYFYYRAFIRNSLQTKRNRRHFGLRAAFELLCVLSPESPGRATFEAVQLCLPKLNLTQSYLPFLSEALFSSTPEATMTYDEFYALFNISFFEIIKKLPAMPTPLFPEPFGFRILAFVQSKYFQYFQVTMIVVALGFSVSVFSTDYQNTIMSAKKEIFSGCLGCWFLLEMILVLCSYGPFYYINITKMHIFELCISSVVVLFQMAAVIIVISPLDDTTKEILNFLVCVAYLLLIMRLVKRLWFKEHLLVIGKIFAEFLFGNTSLLAFLFVSFYFFAILGEDLFAGTINENTLKLLENTTYVAENYQKQNFDDMFGALTCLWDLMVVNNWFVIMDAYAIVTTEYSRIFFIAWFIVSVLVALNLVIAYTIDSFVNEWEVLAGRKEIIVKDKHAAIMRRAENVQSTDLFYKLHMNETHVLRLKSFVSKMYSTDLKSVTNDEILEHLQGHTFLWPIIKKTCSLKHDK